MALLGYSLYFVYILNPVVLVIFKELLGDLKPWRTLPRCGWAAPNAHMLQHAMRPNLAAKAPRVSTFLVESQLWVQFLITVLKVIFGETMKYIIMHCFPQRQHLHNVYERSNKHNKEDGVSDIMKEQGGKAETVNICSHSRVISIIITLLYSFSNQVNMRSITHEKCEE